MHLRNSSKAWNFKTSKLDAVDTLIKTKQKNNNLKLRCGNDCSFFKSFYFPQIQSFQVWGWPELVIWWVAQHLRIQSLFNVQVVGFHLFHFQDLLPFSYKANSSKCSASASSVYIVFHAVFLCTRNQWDILKNLHQQYESIIHPSILCQHLSCTQGCSDAGAL